MVEPFESEESIFADALEIKSAAERAAFLDRACGVDQALRASVEALLRAHERSGDLLDLPEAPTTMVDNVTERPGMIIGPYKLLEQIGEGGFAVVFMAEQTEPVRRKVALKILKPGMDSKQIIARFEVERQALALMDHRHIARVVDAGQAKSGRPYFVMDLVKGLPITEYCDQHQLAPRERLQLFIDVCQAVQHAHQKGIIHRDLKPTNVLVTVQDGTPLVKVIDFGIAKALHQPLTDKTLFTGFAQMVGTPLYMSPEQTALSNVDADTRSDIYSLGVLLYELLTGTTPFDKSRLRTASYDEIRRIIREEEPPRPSTRLAETVSAAHKGQQTNSDAPQGTGPSRSTLPVLRFDELDWVVMKCLEKERNRRYETANGLARDIERYLDDEPVLACPPSTIYRLRKFARRNKAAVLSVTAIFLVLIGGIAGTTWGLVHAENAREAEAIERQLAVKAKEAETLERQRAEIAHKKAAREAAIASAINDFLNKDLLQLVSPFEQLSHGVTPDANLRMRTVLQLAAKRIDGKFPNEPDVEMQLRYTIGYALYRVNDNRGAMAQCRKIVPYFQQTLGPDHPKTMAAMYLIARLHFRLKQYDIALPLLEQSLEKHRIVHGPHHAQTFNVINVLSIAYSHAGHQEKALQLAKELLELRKQHLAPSHGDTLVGMNNVAYLYQRQGDVAKALALFEETLHAMQAKFPPLHPETVNTKRNLAHAYHVAELLDKAVPLQEAVVREYKTVHGIDDQATQTCIDNLLTYYVDMGWCDKAESLLPSINSGDGGPTAHIKLGQDLLREFGHRTLIQGVRPSADKYQQMLAEKKADHPDTLAARQAFAVALRKSGRLSGAAYHLKAVLDVRKRLAGDDHVDTHVCRLEFGTTRIEQRKYAEAEPLLLEAYAGLKENSADADGRLVQATLDRLVRLYVNSNQKDKADDWRKKLDPFKKQ